MRYSQGHFFELDPPLTRDAGVIVHRLLLYLLNKDKYTDDYIGDALKKDLFNESFKEFSEENILHEKIFSSQEFSESCSENALQALSDLCDFETESDKKVSIITPKNFSFSSDQKNLLKKIIFEKISKDVEIVQRHAKSQDKLLPLQEFLVSKIGQDRFRSWFSDLQVSQRSTDRKLILYANRFVVDTIISRFAGDILNFAVASKVEIIFYSFLQNNFNRAIIKNYKNSFQNDDSNSR